ncbi:asparaginase [Candidatus Woesearchaeota archaeon]|nr:asparaginase [Candidatus Woesearchaeota archaeon]
MKLKIFATGGTFDKIYNEVDGSLIFKETHVNNMLHECKNKVDIEIETIMLIDSLYMKDHHRQEILNKCKSYEEDRIVITHGTDTMIETAKLLGDKIRDKTIVLTGSLIPYSFVKSDAHFNLGCAIAFAQILPRGVYIAMHGKIFSHDNVRKNKETLEFETIK